MMTGSQSLRAAFKTLMLASHENSHRSQKPPARHGGWRLHNDDSGPKRFQHQLITAGEHTTFNTALKNLDEHWECVAVAVHNGVIMGVVKREKE